MWRRWSGGQQRDPDSSGCARYGGQVDSGDAEDMVVAREVVNAGLCKQAMAFGGGYEYSKWKEYYLEKGIELRTQGDYEKVRICSSVHKFQSHTHPSHLPL